MVYYGFTQLDGLLQMWASFGVFSVLIPFVLMFAVVFAILEKSRILGAHRGIDVIVSISIALLALQWDFMPRFFAELFPRLGMAIAILLSLVILVGMFITTAHKNIYYIILASVAFIIFIIMLIQTYGGYAWTSSWFWQQWGGLIVTGLVIIGLILVFVIPKRTEHE